MKTNKAILCLQIIGATFTLPVVIIFLASGYVSMCIFAFVAWLCGDHKWLERKKHEQ